MLCSGWWQRSYARCSCIFPIACLPPRSAHLPNDSWAGCAETPPCLILASHGRTCCWLAPRREWLGAETGLGVTSTRTAVDRVISREISCAADEAGDWFSCIECPTIVGRGIPIMKSVVITGTSTGIGWAAAKTAARPRLPRLRQRAQAGRRRPPQIRIWHQFHAPDFRRHR